KMVLDSVTEHIVVIDRSGAIRFVNRGWIKFGNENSSSVSDDWIGINYIDVCDRSAAMGEELGKKAAEGIRKVISNELPLFYFEYPCNSPEEKRWFMMRITPFRVNSEHYYVISHQNITERKLAEEAVANMARIDGLTNIPNRRTFDEFLKIEWKRCLRLKQPLSLAIIDIDHFKKLNDRYGHQTGDECLVKIGELLKSFARRPADLSARYGGEEFAIIMGDTRSEHAAGLMNRLLDAVADLKIPNEDSSVRPTVSVSVGLATVVPVAGITEKELIEAADKLLYTAKKGGRNRVAYMAD
ncbi:MAG: diguanylate cyclase, partial [Nitrospirae bacterium]|nr:diguanylate cyclase [Nitrospirota bacterium]